MNRKFSLLVLISILTIIPFEIRAYSLLIIDSQFTDPYLSVRRFMLEELETRGFVQGKNLLISQWSLGNSYGMARRAWITEKDKGYDLILLNGTAAVQSFRDFAFGNDDYRFLFGTVTDPVGLGVIKDFTSYPKSNFTGVAYPVRVRDRLRFIVEILPEVRDIGLIYADMPQSHSYMEWLEEILAEKEFSHLRLHFRTVEFISSESGQRRMIMLAERHILELSETVDIFISPNGQFKV